MAGNGQIDWAAVYTRNQPPGSMAPGPGWAAGIDMRQIKLEDTHS